MNAGDLTGAVQTAEGIERVSPKLKDYAEFVREQAGYRLQNFKQVEQSATAIFDFEPASPLVGAAAALAVHANVENNRPDLATSIIRNFGDRIPEPQSDLLLAQSLDAAGDLLQAVKYFQTVYYDYPSTKEAADAANALVDLKARLGSTYPEPQAAAMISRAQKLFDSRNPAAAKIELASAVLHLGGAERDLARVKLGVADFLLNNTRAAFEYLSSLKVEDESADAERLDYLVRSARKLDKHADVNEYLVRLAREHSRSLWRLDSLISIADEGRVENNPAVYLPLYRACASDFPEEGRSAWCSWQLAFQSYKRDEDDEESRLREYLRTYGNSTDANNALYFFGRLAERKNDLGSARACYDELLAKFPNTYYALVARERLKDPGMKEAHATEAMTEFLRTVKWSARPEFPSFEPGFVAGFRLERARALDAVGLKDFAEAELKFGANTDSEQENIYAFELAKMSAANNAQDEAVRVIKRYAPGYLYMPLDQAPTAFWRLAFPLPYRAAIEQYSRNQSLDPYLVAALIRQESEFNAKVISRANAYGLMQLLPSTGRELGRKFGLRRLAAVQLLAPERNIQLGTLYFHNLLNSYGGQVELALASYNAGLGRANVWRTWGPFREQPEFIEAVPFHETRNYVQVVLRNAEIYRRLYAAGTPDIPAYRPKPAPRRNPNRSRKRSPKRVS